MSRPERYKENNSSRDFIDEFCATKSAEEVRGAFLFNLGKYQRRYGKKDDHLQEALKIQDYANRLVEYERSLVKPIIRELYTDADQEKARAMIAAAWEEGEMRMEQIGRNSGDGLHYGMEWQVNTGSIPNLPGRTKVEVEFVSGGKCLGQHEAFAWDRGQESSIARWRIAR